MGEKFEGSKPNSFLRTLPVTLTVTLEHEILSLHAFFHQTSPLNQSFEFPYSFGSPDESHSIHCIIKFSSLLSFSCHASVFKRIICLKIQPSQIPVPIPVSVHVLLIHQLHLFVSFVSLMGDTSRPSLDKSIIVDFITLSRS
jgi:hypothetical protein